MNKNQKALSFEEEKEFRQLVEELRSLKFIHSYQVSRYIIDNQLGCKYKNISGDLEMSSNSKATSWKYEGGISPKIYAKLCKTLNLDDKKTDSYVNNFTPYKDIS